MTRTRAPAALLLAVLTLTGCGGRQADGDDLVLWCYRTLADPECYTEPDPTRRTGFLGTVVSEAE